MPSDIQVLVYQALENLDLEEDGRISVYLNSVGYSSLTVCPACRVDDFAHAENCVVRHGQ